MSPSLDDLNGMNDIAFIDVVFLHIACRRWLLRDRKYDKNYALLSTTGEGGCSSKYTAVQLCRSIWQHKKNARNGQCHHQKDVGVLGGKGG